MSIVFFLLFSFLLTEFHPFITTLISAPLMIITRGVLAWIGGAQFGESMVSAMPEAIFLLVYGALFTIYIKYVSDRTSYILQFVILVMIDFIANLVEIYIRIGMSGITHEVMGKLFAIGIGRTTIAVILVMAMNHYSEFMIRKEEQQRYQSLLLLIANLKSEMIWMNKNAKDIENITANAYDIYQYIKENGNHLYQGKSLELAKDIHEIKKEYFLIMRGINEALMDEDSSDSMRVSYLLQTVQESLSTHYQLNMGQLKVKIELDGEYVTDKHYCLLSILRNLITNAIEAGKNREDIIVEICANEDDHNLILSVEDNCGGIEKEDLNKIFISGFSTKIDYENGSVGRGLGLCIVKDLVELRLEGSLSVNQTMTGSKFLINVPKENLI